MGKTSSLSKKDLLDALELINFSIHLKKEKELRNLFGKVQNILPSRLIACGITKINANIKIDKIIKIFNHSFPNDLIAFYLKLQYQKVDPVIRTALNNEGRIVRRTVIFKNNHDKLRKEYIKDASDIGLLTGLSYGVFEQTSSIATLFSFCDKDIERHRRHEIVLGVLMHHLHLSVLKCFLPKNIQKLESNYSDTLTHREKEIIKWVKEGKTNWEISCILNISESTVKYHLKNIFIKLDVTNRCQAVARAIHTNLLNL
ncbi:LuxR family transcriptional regulator [Candidatus Methylacidiphilum fumarolicum]|uniref:Transcriptional regulator LuxR family n=2 Tax=Candidatus Methylacidiphilum fumarolicum TaxID=591154 RepID=I0JZG4_METFB|nr:LuxR family transcriptional regulator [Candidatus Methylacidiphilum fumarolicum]MBW6415763.1 LuxR family transcriptional regulator [Candidatus Methylacidiphilum fumarolicum]TFE66850.1 LuxR family transcriptional regulator [Candidatus Methylacidiphilum fumarolicum]TFE72284.1 LuxR family transcriptional regulator [Candidatus Methylacidiphilum fumarolicum]TFE72506.1 LuxR family transcriptional regulator [Candidatus Methylacidiphilum fumarolicum]TFE77679.1 LuxR family transcriptional regulator 